MVTTVSTSKGYPCWMLATALVCSILCLAPVVFIITWQFHLWHEYKSVTQCEKPLALWNFMSAVLGCVNCTTVAIQLSAFQWSTKCPALVWVVGKAVSLGMLGSLAMNILGATWVYSIDHLEHHCPGHLYEFTYYYIMVMFILFGCACSATLCGAKQGKFVRKSDYNP
mmetsp:Transcript_23501/g.33165  ORF Transcript_23501/g.33165 Transcript_23501/m.33165 type:complete len:168 (+) Transcript_23501:2-505(+)